MGGGSLLPLREKVAKSPYNLTSPANAGAQIEPVGVAGLAKTAGANTQTVPDESGPRHSPGRSDRAQQKGPESPPGLSHLVCGSTAYLPAAARASISSGTAAL